MEHERQAADDEQQTSGTSEERGGLEEQPGAVNAPAEAAIGLGAPLRRLSLPTQQVLTAAAEQARQLGHGEIRPEHILVALLLDQNAVVSRPMLRIVGSSREELAALRETMVERLRALEPGDGGEPRLSDGCKQVLQTAIAEVAQLPRVGPTRVDPIHLLVGLIMEGSAIQGTSLATSLALRGLRVAVGTGVWRAGEGGAPGRMVRGFSASALNDPAPLTFPAPSSQATSAADPAPAGTATRPEPATRAESATRDNVITLRVTDADLAAVDALVDAGTMRTRSEASAWLLQSGIDANQPFFDQIREIRNEITRLRQEVQRLADAHIGRTASPGSTGAVG